MVDPEIGFVYEKLDALDPAEEATRRKTDEETDTGYITAGVISPLESRTRLASDKSSPYASLDLSPEALPEPPAAPGEEQDENGNVGNGEEAPEGNESPDIAGKPPQQKNAVKPGNAASEKSNKPIQSKPVPGGRDIAMDRWNESEHPRGQPENAGEFAKGTGEASGRKNVIGTSNGLPVDRDGKVELTHYSNTKDIRTLNPHMYGSGLRGAESKRMQNDPDNWVSRSYHSIGEHKKEAGLGNNKYLSKLPADKLYDFRNDPDNLQKNLDYAGGEEGNAINLYEKAIKDAGYEGYWVNNPQFGGIVAATFNHLPVTQVTEKNYPAPVKTLPDDSPLLVESRTDHSAEAQSERVSIGLHA